MALPTIRSLSGSDRNMLRLLMDKYHRRGFEVYALRIEGEAHDSTMGYQTKLNAAFANHREEFRFQKYSGGLFKARWMVAHMRLDEETGECFLQQFAWVSGLANALAEAEELMAGKKTAYPTHVELAEAVAAGWA